MAGERDFDLIIFGATGFTGFFMVRELLLSIKSKPDEYSNLRWAIAGRNVHKLEYTCLRLAEELNIDLSRVVKLTADVSNPESLLQMAQKTRLLVNVVGPYSLYGKAVIEACIRSGTHHLDISAEITYIESSQIEYDAQAKEAGSLVISTVGWDSVPNDIGTDYLKTHFHGYLHSVESYSKMMTGPEGYTLNYGTFASIAYLATIDAFPYYRIHRQLYSALLTKELPKSRISHSWKLYPFTRPDSPGWIVPFIGTDKPTVDRSQYYLYDTYGERPVIFQPYFHLSRFLYILLVALVGLIVWPLWFFSAGRNFVERNIETITAGYFSTKGPTREQVNTTRFSVTLIGRGWSRKEGDDPIDEPKRPLDKKMTVVVSGKDPGYQATATCAIQAALTVLKDREMMPKGGVLTPASAFRGTKLVDRLQERDFKFDILDD